MSPDFRKPIEAAAGPANNKRQVPSAREVLEFHTHADKDGSPTALHHTLGVKPNQASPGNHVHDGGSSALIESLADVTITGSRSSGAAVASIISALEKLGATDSTTP